MNKNKLTTGGTYSSILSAAQRLARETLETFALSPNFAAQMGIAFGQGIDARGFQIAWAAGDLKGLPQIEVRQAADINLANGAYAEVLNISYLSGEFLGKNAGQPEVIASVLLEEIGHYVDTQLNTHDSFGDEGAIFSALVRGEVLTTQQLATLQVEDDTAIITLDGQVLQIEQSTIVGTDGKDTLNGTVGDDTISGDLSGPFFGDDTIYGGDGNDKIYGEYPSAMIMSNLIDLGSNDYLDGGDGNDVLNGDGSDSNDSTRGNDTLLGGKGDDSLFGYGGDDYLNGGDGNDVNICSILGALGILS